MNRFQVILAQLLSQYRRQTLIGGIGVGGTVVLLTGAWLLLNWVTAPAIPDPEVATVEQVATFLSHERGLARLPIERRKEVLGELMAYYGSDPARREVMVQEVEQMAPRERIVLREAVIEIAKVDFINDAKEFLEVPKEQREEFVEKKMAAYESVRQGFRGQGGGRDIGKTFMQDPGIPTRSDAWTKELVTRTNARERALARPYVERISAVAEQRKVEARGSKRGSEWWQR